MNISIQKQQITYNSKDKVFTVSGKNVRFSTEYSITNDDTRKTVEFEFTHSTGSEWDPNTIWVYNSKCEQFKLHVLNDDVTPQHAAKYLKAKLKN